jgi:hypothetical protein
MVGENGFTPQKGHDYKFTFSLFSTPPECRQNRLGGAHLEGGGPFWTPPLALAELAARNYYNIRQLAKL